MIIGFTGTRKGLTPAQDITLHKLLNNYKDKKRHVRLHHGDCVGADETCYHICKMLFINVVAHPPTLDIHRAFTRFNDLDLKPLPYLERNKKIVDSSKLLIACPKGKEQQRSGTWSTVRYARKQGKNIIIIKPNGVIVKERKHHDK